MAVSLLTDQSLARMLPYDPKSKKNKDVFAGLKDYSFLLNVSIEAIDALEKGDLIRFDALVGENACQIRAVWVAMIAKKGFSQISNLKSELKQRNSDIQALLAPKKINNIMKSGKSLDKVISEENLGVSLTLEQTALIESFMLAEVQVPKDPKAPTTITQQSKMDPSKLKKFGPDVTGSFLKNIVHETRKHLSAISVQFVRQCAAETRDESLIQDASTEYTHLDHLSCIPMFTSCQVMLKKAQNEGIPLILHAKFVNAQSQTEEEEYLYFDGSKDRPYFQREPVDTDLLQSAWVIEGVVCPDQTGKRISKEEWRERVLSQPIEDTVLKGPANHRQFPNEKIQFSTPKLKYYSLKAEEEGYSMKNPTFFFINHIFPTSVGKIPALVSKAATVALPSKECFAISNPKPARGGGSELPYSKFTPRMMAPYVPSPT